MSKKKYETKTGKILTDADIDALAAEEEAADYDVEELMTRRGRPPIDNPMTEVLPIRLDRELREAVERRAEEDHLSNSDVVRAALREYLKKVS